MRITLRDMDDDEGKYAPGYHGVTEDEIDQTTDYVLGDALEEVRQAYAAFGPPPEENLLCLLRSAFGAGYGAGFRRSTYLNFGGQR